MEDVETQNRIEMMVMNDAILPQVDQWLAANGSGYVAGSGLTVADLVVYQEIQQLLKVTEVDVDWNSLDELSKWKQNLDNRLQNFDQGLQLLNQKLSKLLKEDPQA